MFRVWGLKSKVWGAMVESLGSADCQKHTVAYVELQVVERGSLPPEPQPGDEQVMFSRVLEGASSPHESLQTPRREPSGKRVVEVVWRWRWLDLPCVSPRVRGLDARAGEGDKSPRIV